MEKIYNSARGFGANLTEGKISTKVKEGFSTLSRKHTSNTKRLWIQQIYSALTSPGLSGILNHWRALSLSKHTRSHRTPTASSKTSHDHGYLGIRHLNLMVEQSWSLEAAGMLSSWSAEKALLSHTVSNVVAKSFHEYRKHTASRVLQSLLHIPQKHC